MSTRQGVKLALTLGVLLCLTAVAIGAFGAHALAALLEQNNREATYELANRYQFYHGLALLGIGLLALQVELKNIGLITVLMAVGTVVFSGSLYAMSLTNLSLLGAITPIGGLCLVVAWLVTLANTLRLD